MVSEVNWHCLGKETEWESTGGESWPGERLYFGEELELRRLKMRLNCRERKMNLAWQPGSGSLCQRRGINGVIRGKLEE